MPLFSDDANTKTNHGTKENGTRGRPHGNGVKVWPDGRRYEGMFYQGIAIGYGTKIFPNGKRVNGYWDQSVFFETDDKSEVLEKQFKELLVLKPNTPARLSTISDENSDKY